MCAVVFVDLLYIYNVRVYMDSCTCVHFCICVHVDTFVSVYMCILLCACTFIFCASWTSYNVFVLSVYAWMQLIVQPMMERGEDKEDGWESLTVRFSIGK